MGKFSPKPTYATSRYAKALPPYFGGKRTLAPRIVRMLTQAGYGPDAGLPIYDAFTGGGSTALYFKLMGYATHTNDIAFRSATLGRALIQNGARTFTPSDLDRMLAHPVREPGVIVTAYTPEHFTAKHAALLDRLIQWAWAQPETALRDVALLIAWRYAINLRPLTQFHSQNAFNAPFEEGRFDEIKDLYDPWLKRNLASPMKVLQDNIDAVNAAIFSNARPNTATQGDATDFMAAAAPGIAYLDPPYPGTDNYEVNYHALEEILQNRQYGLTVSDFSGEQAWAFIDTLLAQSAHHPCVFVSLGSGMGKNKLEQLTDLIEKNRPGEQTLYVTPNHHYGRSHSENHAKNQEWLCMSWRPA